jgi:aminopeptidase N
MACGTKPTAASTSVMVAGAGWRVPVASKARGDDAIAPAASTFDEGKARLLHRLAEEQRLLRACGEVPAHYPPADSNSAYDVTRYEMVIDLQPARRAVLQSTGITATVLHDSLASVTLDYCGLPVRRVFEIGAGLRSFVQQDDRLTVTLSRTYRRGQTFSIVVDDTGSTASGIYGIRWAPAEFPESPATFTFAEPEGARFWFPCHDVPNDKAAFSLLIAVPRDHVVASNGHLVSDYEDVTPDGRARRIFWWVEDEPIATYLIAFAAAPYAILRDDRLPDVPIVNYVYPPDTATARRTFEPLPVMIDYFSRLFGDYPFEKYGHAVALFPGGMEHQTMTLVTERVARDSANYQWLIAHELTHQWFGDALTLRDWRHMWLNEGFATYGDALWYEHEFGADSLRSRMALFASFYRRFYFAGHVGPVVDPPGLDLFGSSSYEKGAWVLHMLRHLVGDETFFSILREYQESYRYGNVVTDDFVATAERGAGRDLSWFFEPWLYGRGFPRYEWSWSADTLASGGAMVRVSVRQAQDTTFYAMPIDFAFRTPAGERRETVFIDRNPQSFAVVLDGPPTDVAFDPGGWILSTVTRTDLSGPPGDVSRLAGMRVLSSPGAPPLVIELTLTPGEPIDVRADIVDIQGRLTATPYRGIAATGVTFVRWSGLTEDGEVARPGVYFARVRVGSVSRSVRLILVR